MRKLVLMLLALFLLLGSAAAAFTPANFERGLGIESVTSLDVTWTDACAAYTWAGTSDENFSTYVVVTTSNVAEFNGVDTNTTAAGLKVCTLTTGQWVTATVYRIDLNNDGYFRNLAPDAAHTFNAGNVADAGLFLMYSVMAAIAGLASLIVIIVIVTVLLRRTGFDIKKLFGMK